MKNFTAHFTKKEKNILVSFKANKLTLRKRKSKEINKYLNTKTNINNISCFNQVATVFNLKKRFYSFFKSKLSCIVNNLKFLELEYVLVKKLLLLPRHTKYIIDLRKGGVEIEKIVHDKIKEQVLNAAKAWLNHKSEERKEHEKLMLAEIQVALEPVPY